ITWFVRNVLPTLRQRVPQAKLLIVGRHPTPQVMELGRVDGVEVVGSVPDVREYMARASVIIAPLLIARGTQNKVLEAMACERAVVCSPGAARGIDATEGQHFLVAHDPTEWVNHIERLMSEPDLRTSIAADARRHVEAHYDWHTCLTPMPQPHAADRHAAPDPPTSHRLLTVSTTHLYT